MIRVLRAAWPALLVIVLALSPFLDKAFTIDDTLFLHVAEHAIVEPLAPMAFTYAWVDNPERMSALLANGPLGGYLLVPTMLAGGAEWVAHLTWWAFLAIAVLASVSLGFQIGLPALYAGFVGVLVVTAPAVLTLASTNMPDIPALALATLGMERMFAWRKDQRWHQAAAAALALGLAPLARSHTVLLWPLAALVPFIGVVEQRDWKAFIPRTLAPVIALPVILFAVTRLTAEADAAGTFVNATLRFFSWDHVGTNGIAFSLQYALTMPIVVWLALRMHRPRWWWAPLFAAATAGIWLILPPVYGPRRLLFAPFAGVTATAFLEMTLDAWRRRDLTRFILVGWTLISLPVVTYLHMSAKYFVPSAPAVALLVALAAKEVSERWATAIMGAGAAIGLVFGLLIVQADARFADVGRRAAAELIAPRVAQGQRVWFAGHWGFQWYAERAGASVLTQDPPHPGPGDAIVSGFATPGNHLVRMFPSRRLVTSLAERRPGGRVMGKGAAFWSNFYGFLPYAWRHDLVERFDLWELPAAHGEGAASETPD